MYAIDYPTITVGERTLVVRYSTAAQVLLRRRGIDPASLNEFVGPGKPDSALNWCQIFACMVDENYAGTAGPDYALGRGPSAEYWLSHFDSSLDELSDVCNRAISKVAEAQRTRLALVSPIQSQAS